MSAVQKLFPAMGTVHAVTVEGKDALSAAGQIKEQVLTMDRLWSVFRQDSEISALNRGEKISAGEDTLCILREGVRLSGETGGAFDMTVGTLTKLWRQAMRQGTVPNRRQIDEALRHTGAHGVRVSCERVKLKKGLSVDLGGIAKGYALDRATELLKRSGVHQAILNFGGTVGAIGEPVRIGVRNPFDPDGMPMGTLVLNNRCAVTSGSYERCADIGGRRIHHIIDPRTGYPSESDLVSVTLVGKNATALDAFATGVFVLGTDRAMPLLLKSGIEAVFVKKNGEVRITDGLRNTFQFHADVRTA